MYVICHLLFIYAYFSPNWEYIKTEHTFLSQNPSSKILNEHPRLMLFSKGASRSS